jgi:hypothetical protein
LGAEEVQGPRGARRRRRLKKGPSPRPSPGVPGEGANAGLDRSAGAAGEKISGGDENFVPGGVGILFSIGGKDPRQPDGLGADTGRDRFVGCDKAGLAAAGTPNSYFAKRSAGARFADLAHPTELRRMGRDTAVGRDTVSMGQSSNPDQNSVRSIATGIGGRC